MHTCHSLPAVLSSSFRLSSPELVVAAQTHVADPWQGLVPALLYDLQVSYLDTWYSVVWDFKLHGDGRALLCTLLIVDGRQAEVCSHEELLASWELFDGPNDCILLGSVSACSCRWMSWVTRTRKHDYTTSTYVLWFSIFTLSVNPLMLTTLTGLTSIAYPLSIWTLVNLHQEALGQ